MKFTKKESIAFILLLTTLLAGLYSCEQSPSDKASVISEMSKEEQESEIARLMTEMQMHHFKELAPAPEFTLPAIDGSTVSLSQFRGKVVVLSFWATW